MLESFPGRYARGWIVAHKPFKEVNTGGTICACVLRILAQPFGCHFGKVGLKSGSSESPGHMASVGVPSFWKILKEVSISESPGKSGDPVAISANIHPTPQRSTGML